MKQTTRTAPNTSHSSLARDDTCVIAPRMPERRLHHPLKSLGRYYRILPVQVVQHILEHQAWVHNNRAWQADSPSSSTAGTTTFPFTITLTLPSERVVRVEHSSDLVTWSIESTVVLPEGTTDLNIDFGKATGTLSCFLGLSEVKLATNRLLMCLPTLGWLAKRERRRR